MAKAVLEYLKMDEIVFVPCGDPPHKSGDSVWDAKHRYEMTKLLVEGQENIVVSDIEIISEGKSYTAKTLTKLKESQPDTKLFFIVGADSLCYMDEWKSPQIIFDNAEIVLIDRVGFSDTKVDNYILFLQEKYNAVIHKVPMENINVSSSFLRDCLDKGVDVTMYTGEKVYNYIMENVNGF